MKRPMPPAPILASSSALAAAASAAAEDKDGEEEEEFGADAEDEEVEEDEEEDDDSADWPGCSFVFAKLIFSPEPDCVLMVNWESVFRLYRPPPPPPPPPAFSADLGRPAAVKEGPDSFEGVEKLLSTRAFGAEDEAELISKEELLPMRELPPAAVVGPARTGEEGTTAPSVAPPPAPPLSAPP